MVGVLKSLFSQYLKIILKSRFTKLQANKAE